MTVCKLFLAAALTLLLPFSPSASAAEISVFAAASLTEALTEIAGTYEQGSGDKITYNFGASSTLARQIEQNAPADLFFSADEAKVDALTKAGLTRPETRRSLLANTLVIVTRTDAKVAPKSAADLAKPEIKKLALAGPTVPAGIYAREYLTKLQLWEAVQGKVVPTENVRSALAAVESGNTEAGIVYKTDALLSKKVKMAVEIPAAEGPKISYPLVVLKQAKQPEGAQQFATYLAGPAARIVFEKYGFGLTQ